MLCHGSGCLLVTLQMPPAKLLQLSLPSQEYVSGAFPSEDTNSTLVPRAAPADYAPHKPESWLYWSQVVVAFLL